jgi:hypothetical protein
VHRSDPITQTLGEMLGPSIAEEALVDAIKISGYSLRIAVAGDLLARDFRLQEEWAYEDPDSGTRRSLDVKASRSLTPEPIEGPEGRSALWNTLLIECKQSRHPYVFFEAVALPEASGFPSTVGLGDGRVRVGGHAGGWSRPLALVRYLGLQRHPFVTAPPAVASMSKARADGKRVELSGEEPFRVLALPLVKALGEFRRFQGTERSRGALHVVHLRLCVAVIDAPLVLVGLPTEELAVRPTPWVRIVVRHPRTGERRKSLRAEPFELIDAVHRTYLPTYLDQRLEPFLRQFESRYREAHPELITGAAAIPGLEQGAEMPEAPYSLVTR